MQLYVDSIQPAGLGDLALRFEALKARLAAEGLFDSARKRPLPTRPRTIAVITSPSGAVWRDISHVLARRWPLVQVVLVGRAGAGRGGARQHRHRASAASRATPRRCAEAGRPDDAPALTILARGGGSLEDLWAFNDERVVRAVVAHPLPVVCGVGHEVDVTLADFAADVRAPTPSAAAEIVVPDRLEMAAALRRAADRLTRCHGTAARRGRARSRRRAASPRARQPGRPPGGCARAGRAAVRPRDPGRRGAPRAGAPACDGGRGGPAAAGRGARRRCPLGARRLGGRPGGPRPERHARAGLRDRAARRGRLDRPRPGRGAGRVTAPDPRRPRRDRRDGRRTRSIR